MNVVLSRTCRHPKVSLNLPICVWKSNGSTIRSSIRRRSSRWGSNGRRESGIQNLSERYHRVYASSVTGFGFIGTGVMVTKWLSQSNRGNNNDGIYSNIEKPWDRIQGWFEKEVINGDKSILYVILGVNTVIFGAWRLAPQNRKLEALLHRHFTCSVEALARGRLHTLLTCTYSHITLPHFLVNMFMFHHFGQILLERCSGRKTFSDSWYINTRRIKQYFSEAPKQMTLSQEKFFALYTASGLASSILSTMLMALRDRLAVHTIGASGAVMGIFTLYCLLFPRQEMTLYGVLNLTAEDTLLLTTTTNIGGSLLQPRFTVDFTGHLGGQSIGYAYHRLQK